jgi:hypothetical protein
LLEEGKHRWEPNDVLDNSREKSFFGRGLKLLYTALELKLEPVVQYIQVLLKAWVQREQLLGF